MRALPSSPEAELGVLQAVMADPSAVLTLCHERRVGAEWFHDPGYATMYRHASTLWTDGKPVDAIALMQSLSDHGELASAGGADRISALFTDGVPSAAGYYLDILHDKRTLREIIRAARETERAAYEDQDDAAGVLAGFERAATAIASGQVVTDRPFRDYMLGALDRLQDRMERKTGLTGLSTGLRGLDKLTGGLTAPDLVYIAAETSGGKTALACRFVEAAAVDAGETVAVFSYEMTNEEVTDRLLVGAAKIDLLLYRTGMVPDVKVDDLHRCIERMQNAKIILRDDPELNIVQVRAVARRIRQRHGLGLIVLDYAQLVPGGSGKKGESREQEVAFISRQCKAMAKELNVPVVVLSQLNDDGKVRESRAIAHDANMLLLIQEENDRHYIRIAKQRNGPRDRVPVTFLKQFARFEDYHA